VVVEINTKNIKNMTQMFSFQKNCLYVKYNKVLSDLMFDNNKVLSDLMFDNNKVLSDLVFDNNKVL
jgi:hypothetical protein